jgi:hypothetical protein
LTLTPKQVAPGVYAFIGGIGGRTYENEAMNANTGFVVTATGGDRQRVVVSGRQADPRCDSPRGPTAGQIRDQHRRTGPSLAGHHYFITLGVPIIGHEKMRADAEERGAQVIQSLQDELNE